jgi:RNA polymerase sigma factor (sigma-70 family)
MANGQLHALIHCLRRLAGPHQAGGLSDVQLLERFVGDGDEAAFEVLVWRHGPMVLNVCRRLLHHTQDAEDAFQATFLTFVRKAVSIRKGETVAGWLYRVAYRVALRAKARSARQNQLEQQVIPAPAAEPVDELIWRDLRLVLDKAIDRLPEKYRTVIVLCYLEGKTHQEAARQLGCPEGTVVSRLARARERLRTQLARRGLALTVGGWGSVLADKSLAAALPGPLVESTIKLGLLGAAGGGTASGVVSAPVASLTEGVVRAMFLTKLIVVATVVLVGCLIGIGLAGLGDQSLAAQQAERPTANASDRPLAEPDGGFLRWKFEKGKPFYQEITTETDQQMKVMGKDVVQHQKQTFYFRWTPKEQYRDDDWVMTQRVEGVKIDIDIGGNRLRYDSTGEGAKADGPLAEFYKALVGSEFELTVPAQAQGLRVKGIDRFLRKLETTTRAAVPAECFTDFNQMLGIWFAALPHQPVQVGDTWTRRNRFSIGPIQGFDAAYCYTYAGKEGSLDKIMVACTLGYQLKEPGKNGEFPFQVKKADLTTGKGTGVILYDRVKGRIVRSEMTLTLQGQLTVAQGLGEFQTEFKQMQKMQVRTTDTDPLKGGDPKGDAALEIQRLKQENERLKRQIQAIEQALRKEPAAKK